MEEQTPDWLSVDSNDELHEDDLVSSCFVLLWRNQICGFSITTRSITGRLELIQLRLLDAQRAT